MPITVIHIKDAPPGWRDDPRYVYIGRPSEYSNPFRLQGEHTRQEVIVKFANFLAQVMEKPGKLEATRRDLQMKTLVCYCKPKDCHGDVIARVANGEDPKEVLAELFKAWATSTGPRP